MERGLSIAASGMVAEQVRQDLIANDLANASTPGYKADRVALRSFGGLLVANAADNRPVGSLDSETRVAVTRPDLEQGPLKETDEPLDVAIEGDGFLSVQTPQGIRYTRNGQLQVDGQGRLVTESGYAVLDRAGRSIRVGTSDGVQIRPDGTVTVAGKPAGTIAVVSLTGPQKAGDTLFTGRPVPAPRDTVLKQGFLEQSGVNPARAMIDMIVSLRAFEASQRVIHSIDDTLGRGVNMGGGAA